MTILHQPLSVSTRATQYDTTVSLRPDLGRICLWSPLLTYAPVSHRLGLEAPMQPWCEYAVDFIEKVTGKVASWYNLAAFYEELDSLRDAMRGMT